MGFALWIDSDQAWAAGTHEYRPMGVAVVALSDIFTPRDFSRTRRPPPRRDPGFHGLFASLGHMNRYLLRLRSPAFARKKRSLAHIEAIL